MRHSARDPLWYRLTRRLPEPPAWVLWIAGYIVLVPLGYLIGMSGISGDLADSPEQGGTGSAIAIAIGWTVLVWLNRSDS